MSKKKVIYRPPESDSEDDYDGFTFGDEFITKQPYIPRMVAAVDQDLYEAVVNGDLDKVKQQMELLNFKVDTPVKGGYTLLMHACVEGHTEIVKYLLEEKHSNPNLHYDSVTPLMLACSSSTKDPRNVEKIIKLLLEYGAIINVSDKYGTTPFMLACEYGHTAVVRLMINDVSFDAVDNQGCTPIFRAIEHNNAEIVKILVDAGVNHTIANRKGYTPAQVAQFHGFYDLLNILPKSKQPTYMVPSTFLCYSNLRDWIPRIFLKSECPEYFQDVNTILHSIDMGRFLEFFAKQNVSLGQFLCMTDEQLKDIGIDYPIYRMKIRKGLLDFHLHHWNTKCIARVSKNDQENFYEILMIAANHLQNLVIVNSSLSFIRNNLKSGTLGDLTFDNLQNFQRQLTTYHAAINELKATTEYLASFSPPKNPLHIDYNEFIAERKRDKRNYIIKYATIVIGISVFICFKAKNILKM